MDDTDANNAWADTARISNIKVDNAKTNDVMINSTRADSIKKIVKGIIVNIIIRKSKAPILVSSKLKIYAVYQDL